MLGVLTVAFLLLFQQMAGTYAGDWSSSGAGAAGQFRFTLTAKPQGAYDLVVTFTLGGDQEVKTTTKYVRVDGNRLEAAYEFDLQGNRLMSKIKGQLSGSTLEGTYETTVVDGGAQIDSGSWKATKTRSA